jgi:chromosome partitioning protein
MSEWTPQPPLTLNTLNGRVIATAGWKGGIGKTTISTELAYLLRAILVDADWDQGGASRALGYRHEQYKTAALLDAMQAGKVPRLWTRGHRADLIPSHPDLEENQPSAEAFATELEKWSTHYNRPMVVDTHPGGCPLTYGALGAASVVVVPAVLAVKEFEALEGMCSELRDYPLLLIPNMVKPSPPDWAIKKLREISEQYKVPVGPVISHYSWVPGRKLKMSVAAAEPVPARAEQYVSQLHRVAEAVVSYVSK